jgi:hypothetical protein
MQLALDGVGGFVVCAHGLEELSGKKVRTRCCCGFANNIQTWRLCFDLSVVSREPVGFCKKIREKKPRQKAKLMLMNKP